MMTKSTAGQPVQTLFGKIMLTDLVDHQHELVRLADAIDWGQFKKALKGSYSADNGRPSCPEDPQSEPVALVEAPQRHRAGHRPRPRGPQPRRPLPAGRGGGRCPPCPADGHGLQPPQAPEGAQTPLFVPCCLAVPPSLVRAPARHLNSPPHRPPSLDAPRGQAVFCIIDSLGAKAAGCRTPGSGAEASGHASRGFQRGGFQAGRWM